MAARQSCILFTQETYKAGTNRGDNVVGGAYALGDVIDCEGGLYLTGDFYGCGSVDSGYAQRVWEKIYTSSNFLAFCSRPEMQEYYSIELLKMAAEASIAGTDVPQLSVDWSSTDAEIFESVKRSTAQMYKANYYTTNNLGVPYLDQDIMNRMYQWNLARLLSNCNSASIQPDDNGRMCVNYRGFKVYADLCEIDGYEYTVYDIEDSTDKWNLWQELNIDVDGTYTPYANGAGLHGVKTEVFGKTIRDDFLVTSVGINYHLKVNYEGITPLRKLIAYVFNSQVAGHNGSAPSYSADGGWADAVDQTIRGKTGVSQDLAEESGVLTTGKLVYVLDR